LIRFLHLSDLHLGWRPSFMEPDLARQIQQERDEVLARAVEYALSPDRGVDLVLIAGDLFETHRPGPELVEYAINQLRRCTAAGKLVVTVPGNHDEFTYRDSVYREAKDRWPGFLVTNPMPELVLEEKIKGCSLYVYSLAYVGGLTRAEPALKDFPKEDREGFHLGIFHGSYDWEGGERSLPLDPEGLSRAGYDYVALGHFHRFRVMETGRGMAVYPGLAAGKGFHDPGTGELVLGEWEPGAGVKLTKLPVPAPRFTVRELDAGQAEDASALAELIAAAGDPGALMRIELQGMVAFPVDCRYLEERTRHHFRHLELVDNTYFLSTAQLEQWSQENTITGFFLRRMKERLQQATSEEEKRLLHRALARGILALQGGKHVGQG